MARAFAPLVLCVSLAAQPLPTSTPEKEGISPERLSRVHSMIEGLVKDAKRSGAITMIVRNGKVVDWKAYGHRDIEAKLPMERDTICNIASMTKTISSVAVLMLLEEGRFELNDPITRYIPELKDMKVFRGGTEHPETSPPKRPMTVRDLLTHTSGMVYGVPGSLTPVHKLYEKADLFAAPNLKELTRKIGTLPLIADPGTAFHYGMSIDVLGYLVEVISGMPFDQFIERRILTPLKMKGSYFVVPDEKKSRVAKVYSLDASGRLAPQQPFVTAFPMPGGGMKSTTEDYARFAQMLLNGGELEGIRLLSRKTVELMFSDSISGIAGPEPGYGFGLGGSLRTDLGKSGSLGSVGDFGWIGGDSTWYRIDPKERMVALLFLQHRPMDRPSMRQFSTLVYQSLN